MQSPAPAGSLAVPPPSASSQLGRWICPQGIQSARKPGSAPGACCPRGYCCFFKTTVLAFLRLVTYCTGMAVLILVLRLRPARNSHHNVCLDANSSRYCLLIVLHAVMTNDRSIGIKRGRKRFVLKDLRFPGEPARLTPLSENFERGKIRRFNPRVSRKRRAGLSALTRAPPVSRGS